MSFFIVVKIDPEAEESTQYLMDMIANVTSYGQDDPEANDGSNNNIYLNMSGDGMEQPDNNSDGQANDGEVYMYILNHR